MDRGTRYRSIGTKHATISRSWFEPLATALTIVEELAGACRHLFGHCVTTVLASFCRLPYHRHGVEMASASLGYWNNPSPPDLHTQCDATLVHQMGIISGGLRTDASGGILDLKRSCLLENERTADNLMLL